MEKMSTKKIIGILTFAIVLFAAMQHLDIVGRAVGTVLGLVSPFLIGGCIAFILNVPMRFLEAKLFGHVKKGWLKKAKRPLSLLLTLVLLIVVFWAVGRFIFPQLAHSFGMLKSSIPQGLARIQQWMAPYAQKTPQLVEWIEGLQIDWSAVLDQVYTFLQHGALNLVGGLVSATVSVVSGMVSFFISFVFAVYLLARKEILVRQAKMLLYANLPDRRAQNIVEIGRLTEWTFASFLSGQCVEALILGCMFVVTLWLLGFPYAMLIGVLVAFTALIPVFGAFIGCIFGAFFILMVNPIQAFWFIVVFLALQQLEANLVYPRVVGHSVRLPSMWVLVAVTLGGSTFGVLGMLVFIPLFAVAYTLIGQNTKQKLRKKTVPEERLK